MIVTAVHFGTTPALFTVVNSTTITAVAPAGLTGTQNVRVTTTPGGQSPISATFTYGAALAAPVITSSNAVNATEGTFFSYTITASGNPAPTFNATGLPAWLSRTGAVVSGTPPAGSGNSSATFTVTATNSEGTSPGVLVTVAIAEPTMGWTVTYSFPVPPVVLSEEQIPLTSFTGWNPAYAADVTDALYDAPNPAALPVNLWAKYTSDSDFVRVPFDNWGPNPSAGNTLREWGFLSSNNSIYISGNNATGNPIQLRLIKT